jgi:aryl-alcohol dehydrogenase-like predicted oxidoreductase
MTLPTRRLGDLTVSAVGLGCMPLSFEHMLAERDRGLAMIHRALDLGITLLDTADIYAPSWDTVGHNEEVVAEALRTYSGPADLAAVVVATKGGLTRRAGEVWGRDSHPDALRRACEASLRRLDRAQIDLYQVHRHDPSMTYAEQVESLRLLQEAGLIRRIGLSNVNLGELEVALDLVGGPGDGGIVSVQNEYSPRYRGEADVLDRCTQEGIAFLPWSPLGGASQAHEIGSLYAEFAGVGAEHGVSTQEAVLAWLLALSPVVVPIPGASRPETVDSIVHALSVELSADEFARLQATVPAQDSMYPEDVPRRPVS